MVEQNINPSMKFSSVTFSAFTLVQRIKAFATFAGVVLLVALCSTGLSRAQSFADYFQSMNNSGREFWLSIPPAAVQNLTPDNQVYIHVFSPVEQEVSIHVPGKDFSEYRAVSTNSVTTFSLSPNMAQTYVPIRGQTPQEDSKWLQAGIQVIAESPVVVQVMVDYESTGEGFTALPVHTLGRHYVISSYPDAAAVYSQTLMYPSEVSIIGVEDNTQIEFTLGGNDNTLTTGDLQPGETVRVTLDRGDVYSVSTGVHFGDLTGSNIEADKPVAVVSANQCANVPVETKHCSYVAEMHSPVESWGTEFDISPFQGRLKHAFVNIVASEENTTVRRNGQVIAVLDGAPGKEDIAFSRFRVASGNAQNATLTSDKPVQISVFNTGRDDDNTPNTPMQIDVAAREHYVHEAVFYVPKIHSAKEHIHHIQLAFQSSEGRLPEHCDIGVLQDGDFEWKSIKKLFPAQESTPFSMDSLWWSAHLPLNPDNVYAIRCATRLGLHLYGTGNEKSYGYAVGKSTAWLRTGDEEPPSYTIVDQSESAISIQVTDAGTGVGFVYLDPLESLGAQLVNYQYSPSTGEATFEIEFTSQVQKSRAIVVMVDRAGNETTEVFTAEPCFSSLFSIPQMGRLHVLDSVNKFQSYQLNVELYNPLEHAIGVLDIRTADSSFFKVQMEDFEIAPGESRNIDVTFEHADSAKTYETELLCRDSCYNQHVVGRLRANVVSGNLQFVTSLDFNTVEGDSSAMKEVHLVATSSTPVTVYSVSVLSEYGQFSHVLDTATLPVILEQSDVLTIPVVFTPTRSGEANGVLKINSDSDRSITLVSLLGNGLVSSIHEATVAQQFQVTVVQDQKEPHSLRARIQSQEHRSVDIRIVNLRGQTVYAQRVDLLPGINDWSLPIVRGRGMHLLEVVADHWQATVPFVAP